MCCGSWEPRQNNTRTIWSGSTGTDRVNRSSEEIAEQFVNLSRCKTDKAMLKQFLDYFALLENYRKAA